MIINLKDTNKNQVFWDSQGIFITTEQLLNFTK